MYDVVPLSPPLRIRTATVNGNTEFVAVALRALKEDRQANVLGDLNASTTLLAVRLPFGTGTPAMEWVSLTSVKWAAVLLDAQAGAVVT